MMLTCFRDSNGGALQSELDIQQHCTSYYQIREAYDIPEYFMKVE
jgi:hypothetical protein